MHGLNSSKLAPHLKWRGVIPAIILLVGSLQLLFIFAYYMDVSVPIPDTWRTTKANTLVPTATQFDVQQRLTKIPTGFAINDPNETDNYQWYTEAKLRQLTACMTRGDCPLNADKVVIFSGWHCEWALYDGYRGGEGVWCLGMIRSLERQGFTVLHGGDNDWSECVMNTMTGLGPANYAGYIYHLHRQLGEMVKVIVADPGEESHKGTFAMYQKTAQRPDGIPAWKWFKQAYYPTGDSNVVGKAWIVSAEPRQPAKWEVVKSHSDTEPSWLVTGTEELDVKVDEGAADFTFIGYGLMPYPEDTKVAPWSERPYRVYILAKQAHYFHNGHQHVYDFDFFTRAHEELSKEFPGFEFVGGFSDERSEEDKAKFGPVPSVIKNYGIMSPAQFDEQYGKSRLLLGIGSPPLSPSPYRALSRGVPFANPHTVNNDGSWGYQQHESMGGVPEPYAYQVEAFNYTSFVDAIRKAMTTPIEPLRLERMRQDTVDRRLHDWITYDWKSAAASILEQRLAGKETQGSNNVDVFEL